MTAKSFYIPSDVDEFIEYIRGANDFYRGRPRPDVDLYTPPNWERAQKKGWDFAQRMTQLAKNYEARHARVH